MEKNRIIYLSLGHALATATYVVIVAFFMSAADDLMKEASNSVVIIGMLLLFTVSAAITGLLVFGRPVYLFLEGNKKEAIHFALYTVGWLLVLTIVYFLIITLVA